MVRPLVAVETEAKRACTCEQGEGLLASGVANRYLWGLGEKWRQAVGGKL